MGPTTIPYVDDRGWQRLGREVLHERSRRWRTREEFAQASGVSARVIDDLEKGRRDNYLDSTLAAIEVTLGWSPGTCMSVVQGGRVRWQMDPYMVRVVAAWPSLPREARSMIADLAERARTDRP